MGTTKKPSLANVAAATTKRLLGVDVEKPATVQLPRAVFEIHVAPDAVIPPGTVITEAIAIEAGMEESDLDELEARGHIDRVEVYAAALTASDEG